MKLIKTIVFYFTLILLGLLFLTLFYLMSFFARNRKIFLRKGLYYYCKFILFINKVKLSIKGVNNIPKIKSVIFASNHQSFIDVIVLLAVIPVPYIFITWDIVYKVPILGQYLKKARYIKINRFNMRKNYQTIIESIEAIKKDKESILIFPEGKINNTGKVSDLERGIEKIALETDSKVVPITILGCNKILDKSFYFDSGRVFVFFDKPLFWKERKKSNLLSLKRLYESNLEKIDSEVEK